MVPAWNEGAGIARTLDAAVVSCERLEAEGLVGSWEIVVVDDGSTDDTATVVGERAATEPRIRLVRHPANVGLGGAIATGFGATRGEWAVYVDADLPFDLDEIGTAIRLQQRSGAGIVAAYRRSRGDEGPRRALYSVVYNLLARVLFGLEVRDVNFAGKLVTRDVLDVVDLRSRGSFIDVELLARARNAGFAIEQFGVDYLPRTTGVSTLASGRVIRTIVVEMASIGPEVRRGGHGRRGAPVPAAPASPG